MIKVLITRPRSQADSFAEALAQAGFEPVFFPVIEIRPIADNVALERAIEKLSCYDWVVFTSVNGVEVFFERLGSVTADTEQKVIFAQLKTAAIGPKTADAMLQHGVTPNFVPEEYVAEAILPGLGDLRGRWVLLPRAEKARAALPEAIAASGGIVHEIAVYQTIPATPEPAGLAALKSGVGAVTFTSPSTVENFAQLVRQAGLDPLHLAGNPKIACIGPITHQTALNLGFTDLIVAEEYTTGGLVRLLSRAAQEAG
jgi:uroporphyrinogen-III synthase